MTVWILHQPLTPEEEGNIQDRAYLPLPFDGLPDLSGLHSREQCRKLLQSLDPGAPPETLARQADHVWRRYGEMKQDDTVAVPLKSRREVALAEVTQPYRYHAQATGVGAHQLMVKWHKRRIAFFSLRKHLALLADDGEALAEVSDGELRIALRSRLPHGYNRFAGWKWLLVVFFILNIIRQMMGHVHPLH